MSCKLICKSAFELQKYLFHERSISNYGILGDPGAVSRVDKMFVVKVYGKIEKVACYPLLSLRNKSCVTKNVAHCEKPGKKVMSSRKV